MTYQKAQEKAFNALSKLTVEQVKETVIALFNSDDEHATDPLNWAMSYLETLLPEDEYIEFCENL